MIALAQSTQGGNSIKHRASLCRDAAPRGQIDCVALGMLDPKIFRWCLTPILDAPEDSLRVGIARIAAQSPVRADNNATNFSPRIRALASLALAKSQPPQIVKHLFGRHKCTYVLRN